MWWRKTSIICFHIKVQKSSSRLNPTMALFISFSIHDLYLQSLYESRHALTISNKKTKHFTYKDGENL